MREEKGRPSRDEQPESRSLVKTAAVAQEVLGVWSDVGKMEEAKLIGK